LVGVGGGPSIKMVRTCNDDGAAEKNVKNRKKKKENSHIVCSVYGRKICSTFMMTSGGVHNSEFHNPAP
jgi:hypothetical protein